MTSDAESFSENKPTPNAGRKPDVQATNPDPNVTPAPSVPSLPPSETHCKVTYKIEKDWWGKFKPFAEMAGIVILAIYTFYTAKMYRATNKAAQAAKGANEILLNGQRPWVGIIKPVSAVKRDLSKTPEHSLKLRMFFTNSGNSPALYVWVNAFQPLWNQDVRKNVNILKEQAEVCRKAEAYLMSGSIMLPHYEMTRELTPNSVLPWPIPIGEKGQVMVNGCIVYRAPGEGEKVRHHTRWCVISEVLDDQHIKDFMDGKFGHFSFCNVGQGAD